MDEILLGKPDKTLDSSAGFGPNATGTTYRGDTTMKVGIISILAALLLALPAFAGTEDCTGPDTDTDGVVDMCDNCSADINPGQTDGDQDGFGDACDCDYDNNIACDGADFGAIVAVFGTVVPPTDCEYDYDSNGAVAGADFGWFVARFGSSPLPGPSCGNAPGTPCPDPGAVCP
jgi:hypothetical protein